MSGRAPAPWNGAGPRVEWSLRDLVIARRELERCVGRPEEEQPGFTESGGIESWRMIVAMLERKFGGAYVRSV